MSAILVWQWNVSNDLMTTRNIIILGLSLTLLSCGQSINKADNNNSVDKTTSITDTLAEVKPSIPDTSNQNIYDFMKVVIADQKLDLSYGLTKKQKERHS